MQNNNFQIPSGNIHDKELYKSQLGTPVVTDLKFLGKKFFDSNGKEQSFEDFTIAAVLMTVTQSKLIVRTQIQGSDTGSVKEYIGMDDYEIDINLTITGKNGSYPADEVRALKEILDYNGGEIGVVSGYLQNLKIYSLIIQDYAMDQEPGGYSKQNVSIKCLSDLPVELQIK